MKVLVIGAGGREHALCWKLRQSPLVSQLYCAPGNPGTKQWGKNVPLKVDDLEGLSEFATREGITLTVVGPEYPLSCGIVDHFRSRNLPIFGPTKAAACLEGSKSFSKEIMVAAGVPTARSETFTDKVKARQFIEQNGAPIVLKADGLAAGKGVFVCLSLDEAYKGLDSLFSEFKDPKVLIEQFLAGVEVSYIVATDGERVLPFAPSHDYKRIFEDDKGPNTGGMGTVCPTPRFTEEQGRWAAEHVIQPVLQEMKKRGTPFSGFLYAGLMISPEGKINVLEFNARMGDPECQSILRKLDSDLFQLLASLSGVRDVGAVPTKLKWRDGSAVCVVLAAEGYPGTVRSGDPIEGIELTQMIPDCVVFQAGTSEAQNGGVCTAGGRVLNVTAVGDTVEEARLRAYKGCDLIQYRGRQVRRDIGLR